jgi:hypothetical protein
VRACYGATRPIGDQGTSQVDAVPDILRGRCQPRCPPRHGDGANPSEGIPGTYSKGGLGSVDLVGQLREGFL